MVRPQNIVFIVADSLRYDSVLAAARGETYLESAGTAFSQARSSGCWTLPATASMFTGLLPHEHGATAQSRSVYDHVETLPQWLQGRGYETWQITANTATTEVFGLDRGFDRVLKVWHLVPQRHQWVDTVLWVVSRPRIRKKIFNQKRDLIAGRLGQDVHASRSWMQSNADAQLEMSLDALRDINGRGKGAFLFVNLMESHFPYHIADTFECWANAPGEKLRELRSLFHFVNQTRLTSEHDPIAADLLERLRQRQARAWERLAPKVDAFVREVHEGKDTLVVFCSDHGDAFGEQRWQYHFSNVTDGGNRTPLTVLKPGQRRARTVDRPVSMRHLAGMVRKVVDPTVNGEAFDLELEPERSTPILEAFWYNKAGATLPRYRYNQFAFIAGGDKFVHRKDGWLHTPVKDGAGEDPYRALPSGTDPITEAELPGEARDALRRSFVQFGAFSRKVGEG